MTNWYCWRYCKTSSSRCSYVQCYSQNNIFFRKRYLKKTEQIEAFKNVRKLSRYACSPKEEERKLNYHLLTMPENEAPSIWKLDPMRLRCSLARPSSGANQNSLVRVDAPSEREERIAEAIEIRTPLFSTPLPFLLWPQRSWLRVRGRKNISCSNNVRRPVMLYMSTPTYPGTRHILFIKRLTQTSLTNF